MKIPFGDLRKNYLSIRSEIDWAISRVLKSGWFTLGGELDKFEKEFARSIGMKYCIGVANGLEALQIAFLATGIKPGDEVITTPLSAAATTLAIMHIGARPVYVDIDPQTYNLNAEKIEAAITKNTKAILPVHLYGQMADMERIVATAKKHGLIVVEDCAQAHGASSKGKLAGSWGAVGAFSFYPSKNLGAYGDAGCLVTNNKKITDTARALRDYGQIGKYNHQYAGFNSRLDALQAAVLYVKLRYLSEWNGRRKKIAASYAKLLSGLPLVLPSGGESRAHVWHLYVIRTKNRDQLQKYLTEHGITTQIHYPKTLYNQRALRSFSGRPCLVAEKLVREIISLPIYPELTDKEVFYICSTIKKFFKHGT